MLHAWVWLKNSKDIEDCLKWRPSWIFYFGSKIQTICPILYFFTSLCLFFYADWFEPKFGKVILKRKKTTFSAANTECTYLWPPWEGSKNQFKNLKKLHNAYNVECNQEIPGEHDFSKKVKKWATLLYALMTNSHLSLKSKEG